MNRLTLFQSNLPTRSVAHRAHVSLGGAQLAMMLTSSTLAISCIQATADVPEMELTRENVAFPAMNGDRAAGAELTIVQQFSYANSRALPESISADMRATEVTFRLREGAKDLSFIHAASLSVSKPTGEAERVFDYRPDGNNAPSRSVTVPIQSSPESLNPWSVATSNFELTLTGVLPTQGWSADISLRYTGTLSLSL